MNPVLTLTWSAVTLLLLLLWPAQAAAQPSSSSDLYLIAIGVSHYPLFKDARLQLRYADDDASALVAWAETQQGHLYRQVNTRLVLNEQATRAGIITALISMLRSVDSDDQVIIFLSGHGLVESTTGKYHFLTYDTDIQSEAALAATALSQLDLLNTIEQASRQARRVLLLLDTCQSGAVADARAAAGEKGLVTVAESRPNPLDEKARVNAIISAGTAGDKAVEGPQYRLDWEPRALEGHGVFTWALLQALSTASADANHNGLVFLGELWSYVSDRVRQETHGRQLPESAGRQADIPLAWVPDTPEVCDGRDNDLDGLIDEGQDLNKDGQISLEESFDRNGNRKADCLENELCNGVDDNVDGQVDEGFDLDGDGHRSMQLCGSRFGDDPDDSNYAIHPDQKDWGNLRDDDGDGFFDEDSPMDRWDPTVPDSLEKAHLRRAQLAWSSGAGGLLALGLGGLTLASLGNLIADIREDSRFTDEESQTLAARILSGGALGVLGVVGFSLSGSFAWDAHRVKVQLYPVRRSLPNLSSAVENARASQGGTP